MSVLTKLFLLSIVHVLLPSCLYFCLLPHCYQKYVITYCTTVYERNGKILFWYILKESGEILNKLRSKGFLASSLSTHDLSTLYTTLPHTQRKSNGGSLYLACNGNHALFTSEQPNQYKVSKGAKIRSRYNQVPHLTQDTNGKVTNCSHFRKCVMLYIIFWTIYL